MHALGDYIDGSFVVPSTQDAQTITSHNPARSSDVVFETKVSTAHMAQACDAAARAALAWAALSMDERWRALERFRDAIHAHAEALADAIMAETGKLRSEARGEVSALLGRFALVHATAQREFSSGQLPGHAHEELRFHPLGVVGVIGPFNYPLHLCHSHVVPALIMGNSVVVKPSEIAPLSGQCYAQAAHDAGLPAGVFNLVHGTAASGRALVGHAAVRGLCFTGSYAVGRAISEQALDRPELLLALEMGGKNTVVVLDDASLRQAAHEIVMGGYLTTGQRCTATDRVLVQKSVLPRLVDALRPLVEAVRFGDPEDDKNFAGPLVNEAARERFEAAVASARAHGAEALIPGGRMPGGAYAKPTLHLLPDGVHHIAGYTDHELFGPDVGIEAIEDEAEAAAIINASPYGFANSVFTASSERFEYIYRHTHSGILNRNRSTNQASPRLPFGGVGKSGNYRPAGAYALRNVVVPVAVQDNVLGEINVHSMLAAHLPEPNLDRLDERQTAEEVKEGARRLLDEPRPIKMCLPRSGRLPTSKELLVRLYAGHRVVEEKKPLIFDHLRSFGPWMVSVDKDPLSVLDGMSQTATLTGGFAEDTVVRAFIEGEFGDTLTGNHDTALGDSQPARAMADTLRHLVPGLPHVTFTNSGAEANEKALALCLAHAPAGAKRVLAFEGSFHGRTLLTLHATYNPQKREPFQIDGYQATFAPFPVWSTPDEQPAAPAGFYAAVARGDRDALIERFGSASEDPLLAAEVAALVAAHDALAGGDHFACIIEPMQAEGGDRYATDRFFRALRLLTRYHQVPLIFDEVQTGFGLGGPFAWHSSFRLVDFRGKPDVPDVVTFAKRAQVGVVMSHFDDPEPTSANPASLVRGRLHAEMMSTAHNAERIETLVKPRLEAIAQAFPHLVEAPRARGYAFAFDLPTADHLLAYLGQRFWRGAVVFGAGSRTVRYRLSDAFLAREVEQLFVTIRRSLAWLDAHPGSKPPAWSDFPGETTVIRPDKPDIRLRDIDDASEAVGFLDAILDMERRIYEPARRAPPEQIRAALEDPDGTVTVAEVERDGGWQLAGFAIGTALERTSDEGPDRDPMRGLENTLYSVSVTVAKELQGLGVGRALKRAQLHAAAARTRPDGSPRYRYISSRNRLGHTASMTHLNRAFGAHVVCVLTGQYEDPEGQAIYYRIPLGAFAPDPGLRARAESAGTPDTGAGAPDAGAEPAVTCDLASGLVNPLADPPASLLCAQASGLIYGPAVNKITLMNYATTGLIRALEWVAALLPELPHMYLTSSRDECVDKSLRIVRWHRPKTRVAIGLEGGYVGHTSAAARSISDPAVHAQGRPYFDEWVRVPHPESAGTDAALLALRQAVERAGGTEQIFGFVYEVVQERTGRVLPAEFLLGLAALRDELDVPLIAVETASAGYRHGGAGAFAHTRAPLLPDILMWWSGGQTGYIHVAPRWFVPTALTMVSTWDGDELSLMRHHHQLRALRKLELQPGLAALDQALSRAPERGITARGLGGYRVLDLGDAEAASARVYDHLARHGVRVRRFANGCLGIAPSMDRLQDAAQALERALESL